MCSYLIAGEVEVEVQGPGEHPAPLGPPVVLHCHQLTHVGLVQHRLGHLTSDNVLTDNSLVIMRLTASRSAVTAVSRVCSSLVMLSTGIPNDWMNNTSCCGSRSLRAESTSTGIELRIILSFSQS